MQEWLLCLSNLVLQMFLLPFILKFQNKNSVYPYLQIIEELEVAGGLRGPLNSLTQGHCTSSTLSPVRAAHGIEGSSSFGHFAD